jgi:hypothetical protein
MFHKYTQHAIYRAKNQKQDNAQLLHNAFREVCVLKILPRTSDLRAKHMTTVYSSIGKAQRQLQLAGAKHNILVTAINSYESSCSSFNISPSPPTLIDMKELMKSIPSLSTRENSSQSITSLQSKCIDLIDCEMIDSVPVSIIQAYYYFTNAVKTMDSFCNDVDDVVQVYKKVLCVYDSILLTDPSLVVKVHIQSQRDRISVLMKNMMDDNLSSRVQSARLLLRNQTLFSKNELQRIIGGRV